jgi:hypothetical protein
VGGGVGVVVQPPEPPMELCPCGHATQLPVALHAEAVAAAFLSQVHGSHWVAPPFEKKPAWHSAQFVLVAAPAGDAWPHWHALSAHCALLPAENRPAGHFVQSAVALFDGDAAEALPAAQVHGEHAALPSFAENWPLGQSVHEVKGAAEKVPAAQLEHVLPIAEVCPAAQSAHVVKGVDDVLPAAQLEHAFEPAADVCPAAQSVHAVVEAENVPAAHFEQGLPSAEICPAAQSAHEVKGAAENIPAGQLVHGLPA